MIFSRIIDAVGRARGLFHACEEENNAGQLGERSEVGKSGRFYPQWAGVKTPGLWVNAKTVPKTSKTASGTKSPDNRAIVLIAVMGTPLMIRNVISQKIEITMMPMKKSFERRLLFP